MTPQQSGPTLISVRVKLYGILRRQRPEDAEGTRHQLFVMQVPPGETVAALIEILNIGQQFVGAVAVNGQAVDVDSPLYEGDELRLFPPSAGG